MGARGKEERVEPKTWWGGTVREDDGWDEHIGRFVGFGGKKRGGNGEEVYGCRANAEAQGGGNDRGGA